MGKCDLDSTDSDGPMVGVCKHGTKKNL